MYPALDFQADAIACERRRQQRFAISSAAQVIISRRCVDAVTADISSGGVLLKSKVVFPVRKRVEVRIDWPAVLDERCGLRLVFHGRVLRSNPDGTAIEMLRYHYRTRLRKCTVPAPGSQPA